MTTPSHGTRSLPLQGSPSRWRAWLVALGFGLPALIILAVFGITFAQTRPDGWLLLTPLVALGISALVMLWILRMLGRIGVALDGDALVVDTGIVMRRFPLAALRGHGFRVVGLDEHRELRPLLRTWGIGLPGLATGWFLLRNRAKALCILTGRQRVTALETDDGTWILLSLADATPLRDALSR